MSGLRMCTKCGVNELPPRCRICEECLVGPRRSEVVEVVAEPEHGPKDHVLSCGHIIATNFEPGDSARCPLHRDVRTVLRLWDGVETPRVTPPRLTPRFSGINSDRRAQ